MTTDRHLTTVLPGTDPLGRSAERWAAALSERAGEPIPYAFALAVARQHGRPPAVRSGACAQRTMSRSTA